MEVFRICHKKWSNQLIGSGQPARWNSKGIYMVYTASSRSLACLEFYVHMKTLVHQMDFIMLTIDIPNDALIEELKQGLLPKKWNTIGPEGYTICRKFGDDWIIKEKSPVLKVPSAIIPKEHNFLFNSSHPGTEKIKIIEKEPFIFDSRLG
jgi:RES domain-containing protein